MYKHNRLKMEFATKKKRLVEKIGECELCRRKHGLEVHHIIPKVCYGSDDENNLIVLCQMCHGRLTSKSELTKLGLDKIKRKNAVLECYKEILNIANDEAEDGVPLNGSEILKLIDHILIPSICENLH